MHRIQNMALQLARCGFIDHDQGLLPADRLGDGGDNASAWGELFNPSGGELFAASCGNDGVVGCGRGVAQHPIAQDEVGASDLCALVVQGNQVLMRFVVQATDAFDGIDFGENLRQYRSLVAATCANF